jgi:hypothetical protein
MIEAEEPSLVIRRELENKRGTRAWAAQLDRDSVRQGVTGGHSAMPSAAWVYQRFDQNQRELETRLRPSG